MKAAGASSAVIPARIAMSCWLSCQAIEIACGKVAVSAPPRRMDAKQVDQRHRCRDGKLDVVSDPDKHLARSHWFSAMVARCMPGLRPTAQGAPVGKRRVLATVGSVRRIGARSTG